MAKKKPPANLSEMDLEELVIRFARTQKQAFRALDRAEFMLGELIHRMKVGQRVTIDKKVYEMVDNFHDKNTAYRPKQFRRLELMDVTPKPQRVGKK